MSKKQIKATASPIEKEVANARQAIDNLICALENLSEVSGIDFCYSIADFSRFHVYKGVTKLDAFADQIIFERLDADRYPFQKTVTINGINFFQISAEENIFE